MPGAGNRQAQGTDVHLTPTLKVIMKRGLYNGRTLGLALWGRGGEGAHGAMNAHRVHVWRFGNTP